MIYRTEHPNPQWKRESWLCLNGEWECNLDEGGSGEDQRFYQTTAPYTHTINVPFCVESPLSGIGYRDFLRAVWYRKKLLLTPEQMTGRIFLHVGAMDYKGTLYVNEQKVGSHKGGYTPCCWEITSYVKSGENLIVLAAEDDTRSRHIPSGKQSPQYASHGCFYTRTTGIWQSVWLEFTPHQYIRKAQYLCDVAHGLLSITAELVGRAELTVEAFFEGRSVGKASLFSQGGTETITLALSETHLWQVGDGKLYELRYSYGEDRVQSYFGLRSVTISGNRVLLNGRSIFQRLVLDQGFYPEGIYTAPTEEDMIADIQRSLALGFNGARLHQKVCEPRYLYHCDRLGYMVWGEFPDWGLNHTYEDSIYDILPEWLEVVERDRNHPSIITWCPFNETGDQDGRKQVDDLIRTVYLATKAVDPTRPCIDTSGNYHVMTDLYDIHDYTQETDEFRLHYQHMSQTHDCADFPLAYKSRQQYDGKKPFLVSEYGGTAWAEEGGWGYGAAPVDKEDFLRRLRELTLTLLSNENICGLCYTQLTDVEQEQNGLYTYNRVPKFDPAVIKEILEHKAAIED